METATAYLPAPSFVEITEAMALRSHYWVIPLPSKYQGQLVKGNGVPAQVKVPSSSGGSSAGTLTRTDTSSTDTSKSEAVVNTSFNPAFAAYQNDNRGFKAMRTDPKDTSYPREVPGIKHTACLPYHLKGKCSTNCSRKRDHIQHTSETDDFLLAWALEHFSPQA
jgi:hypothetical protein